MKHKHYAYRILINNILVFILFHQKFFFLLTSDYIWKVRAKNVCMFGYVKWCTIQIPGNYNMKIRTNNFFYYYF